MGRRLLEEQRRGGVGRHRCGRGGGESGDRAGARFRFLPRLPLPRSSLAPRLRIRLFPKPQASAGASDPPSKPAFQFGAAAAPSAAPAAPCSASFSFGALCRIRESTCSPDRREGPRLWETARMPPCTAADESPSLQIWHVDARPIHFHLRSDRSTTRAADGPEPAPKPAFTFGASAPAPAAPIFGAPPGEKKDVAVEEKAAAPTGWGADFLKNNAAAASVATAAVEKEVNSEAGGASAPTPAPTFKFGAPAADLGVPDAAASAGASEPLSKPAFQFGAAAAPSAAPAAPFSASFSFGASAGSEKAPAAPFTGKAPTLGDPNATVPAADEAPAFKFGTSTPSPSTFTSEVTEAKAAADGPEPAPKPAFTFGASAPAPAAPIFGAPPGEKKDVAVEEKAAAPTGWGADFLKNNAAAASVATAAVEKEVNSEAGGASAPTPAPTFKFGAPAADLGVPDAAASAGASEPLSKPAFQFGAAAAPSDAVAGPVDQGNEVIAPSVTAAPAATGFVFGASSTVPKESAGGFGASFGSGAFGTTVAAPVASSAAAFGSASSAPAFAFGTGKKSGAAGFAFGSQTAAVSAFGAPLGSSAPSSFGSSVGGFGATTPASTATPIVMTPPASNAFGAPTGGFGAPSAAPTSSSFGAPAAGFGAPSASGSGGFGGFGGFGSSAAGGFGSTAPFGGASSTAAFGAPASQGNTNVFGQPAAGQFGAPENGGFQSQPFGAPSAFPPTSAPGQMIPNNPDNPFGGGNAGGFNVGSTGTGGTQSRSEGRRKVRVKRRH